MTFLTFFWLGNCESFEQCSVGHQGYDPIIELGISHLRPRKSGWKVEAPFLQSNWVNYNDLTVLPPSESLVNKGNHPLLWPQFRLVNYTNLPRSKILWIYLDLSCRWFHHSSERVDDVDDVDDVDVHGWRSDLIIWSEEVCFFFQLPSWRCHSGAVYMVIVRLPISRLTCDQTPWFWRWKSIQSHRPGCGSVVIWVPISLHLSGIILVGGLEHASIAFMFPYLGNHHPSGLIFFRGVETTNQNYVFPSWWDIENNMWVADKLIVVLILVCFTLALLRIVQKLHYR